jgi:hypothetical protein
LGTLTGREIWSLKKAVEFALFRMPMGASGRGLVEIFKFITSNKNEAEGLSFSRNRGVTYVTGHQVVHWCERCPLARGGLVFTVDLNFGYAKDLNHLTRNAWRPLIKELCVLMMDTFSWIKKAARILWGMVLSWMAGYDDWREEVEYWRRGA